MSAPKQREFKPPPPPPTSEAQKKTFAPPPLTEEQRNMIHYREWVWNQLKWRQLTRVLTKDELERFQAEGYPNVLLLIIKVGQDKFEMIQESTGPGEMEFIEGTSLELAVLMATLIHNDLSATLIEDLKAGIEARFLHPSVPLLRKRKGKIR